MSVQADGPFPDTRLSRSQLQLLLAMQILYPKPILVCYRQRRGRWSPSTFIIGRGIRFYPRTMDGLWRRGLVCYTERAGGDRLYSLTKLGFKLRD